MSTARVTEAEVMAIPEPEFTSSWHPVSHARVIGSLDLAVRDHGLGVVERNYNIRREGKQMFGTWQLDQKTNGSSWMVGFRNSIDKEFAVGIVAGTHVFVCSNMAFSGKFIEFRRHTGGLDAEELVQVATRSIGKLIGEMKDFSQWHEGLKAYGLLERDLKVLVYDAMKNWVFPPSKFQGFLECYREEKQLRHHDSLYTFHGACTRLSRESSLFTVSERNGALVKIINNHIKLN